MTWTYHQKTGALHNLNGEYIGRGYSGTGVGRDNPELEGVVQLGPIPRGRWLILPAYKHKRLGPVVMNLEPVGHTAKGRSLFRIHGDNKINDASNGCIILSRPLREMITDSGDTTLDVV